MTGSATPTNEPTTVGKTVLTLEIPLYDSGPAGLGVTVFGRSTLSAGRKQQGDMGGDMGVFIKSVVPGGAAALVREWWMREREREREGEGEGGRGRERGRGREGERERGREGERERGREGEREREREREIYE